MRSRQQGLDAKKAEQHHLSGLPQKSISGTTDMNNSNTSFLNNDQSVVEVNTGISGYKMQGRDRAVRRNSIDQVTDAEFLAHVAEAFAGDELGRCVLEGPDGVSFQICGVAEPLIEQLTAWSGPSDQDGIEVHFCDVGRRGRAYPLQGLLHLVDVCAAARAMAVAA